MRNRINTSKWLSCAVLSVAAIGGGSLAHAANTDTWTGAVDTNWSTATPPTNWSGGAVPVVGDALVFDDSGTGLTNTDDIAGLSVSGLAFNGTTNSYVLNGSTVLALTGGATAVTDSSSVGQTINLPLSFGTATTIAGGAGAAATLTLTGQVTNSAVTGGVNLNLTGVGFISDNFASAGAGTIFNVPGSADNWTILNNAANTSITIAAASLATTSGTLNFGTVTSAPNLTITGCTTAGDHTVGADLATSTLNVANGLLLLKTRLNTKNGNISVSGGQLQVWNQMQMDNSSVAEVSVVSVSGGLLDVRNSSGSGTTGNTLFVASRGSGTLNISGGEVRAATLDVSRGAAASVAGVGSTGVVNLNGGLLTVTSIRTASANENAGATGSIGTFNFNGGTLKARSGNSSFIADGGTPNIPLNLNVKAGGAIIDSNTFAIGFTKPLLHDAGLGSTLDGGLTKLSAGILTLGGVSTYTGATTIKGGGIALTSTTSNNNLGSSSAIIVGDTVADSAATLDVTGTTTAGGFIVPGTQTLGGHGTVKGAVTLAANATLSPGNSIGTFTFDGSATTAAVLTLSSGAIISDELNNSFLADQIALINGATGDIVFNNNVINFTDLSAGTLAGGNYTLFSADVANAYAGLTVDGSGNITGGLSIGTGLSAYPGSVLQVVGNTIVLNTAGGSTGAPEPASLGLMGLGAVGLLARRRK